MPILKREEDIFPEDLLANDALLSNPDFKWWSIYTLSRREKDLMRKTGLNEGGLITAQSYRNGIDLPMVGCELLSFLCSTIMFLCLAMKMPGIRP